MPYTMRIKSALGMHQRPTAALLEESDPYTGWTSHDYRLQEAMTIMDSERCTRCGNPVWLCHSVDSRIDFEVVTQTCYADAELKDYEKNKMNTELESGQYLVVKAVGIKDENDEYEPLPSRHEAIMGL